MSGLLGRCVFVLRVTLTRLSPSPTAFIYLYLGPCLGPVCGARRVETRYGSSATGTVCVLRVVLPALKNHNCAKEQRTRLSSSHDTRHTSLILTLQKNQARNWTSYE